MTFNQRQHITGLAIGIVVMLGYLAVVTARALGDGAPLAEVAWHGPMALAVGVGGGVYAAIFAVLRLRTRGVVEDQRDRDISRFAEFSGRGLLDLVALSALVLLILEVSAFWVAHTLLIGAFVASLITTATSIAAYRDGLPS